MTATLTIAVVNNTGADIALASGADAAAFGVYLPSPAFFSLDQLGAMKVTASGWTGTLDAPDQAINITCTQDGTWASGQTLTFTLANVTSSGPPGTGTATLLPSNLGDNAPLSAEAPLAVASPPKPGNLQLTDVLQVTLDSQGSVLRSKSSADPLSNTLYLTLKNTGATALAAGGKRFGNPQVLVSFIYGNTSGALAPDAFDPAKGPRLGSAWNIKSGIASAQLPWTTADPRHDSQDHDPQWRARHRRQLRLRGQPRQRGQLRAAVRLAGTDPAARRASACRPGPPSRRSWPTGWHLLAARPTRLTLPAVLAEQTVRRTARQLRRAQRTYYLAAAAAGCALLGAAGMFPGSAASASTRPPGGSGATLQASLRGDLSQYLAARRTAEHISAVSLRVTYPGTKPAINLAVGTTRYTGGPPVSTSALWQIGSNTKAFTSVILLQLEAEGKLSINDPVGKFLPQYPAWRDITIKRLLNMTSRIPDYISQPAFLTVLEKDPARRFTAAQLVSYAVGVPLNPVGWIYSNTDYLRPPA